jgi:hypothetical protein
VNESDRLLDATNQLAFITCVDYGKCRLEVVTRRWVDGNGRGGDDEMTIRYRRETISKAQLLTRRVLVLNFPQDQPDVLEFRNAMLCGNCGHLADLSSSQSMKVNSRVDVVVEEEETDENESKSTSDLPLEPTAGGAGGDVAEGEQSTNESKDESKLSDVNNNAANTTPGDADADAAPVEKGTSESKDGGTAADVAVPNEGTLDANGINAGDTTKGE